MRGLLILAGGFIGCGCREPAPQELSRSPDGRYVLERQIFGHCGGATVGYRSDLILVDTKGSFGNKLTTLVFAKGLPRPVVHWDSAQSRQSLEIDLYLNEAEEVEQKNEQHRNVAITIRQMPERENVPHRVITVPDRPSRRDNVPFR